MRQPTDSRWREASLCAQTDPAVFSTEVGANATLARRVCEACPVRSECLTDALENREIAFGVRGGLTPTQRQALLNSRNGKGLPDGVDAPKRDRQTGLEDPDPGPRSAA